MAKGNHQRSWLTLCPSANARNSRLMAYWMENTFISKTRGPIEVGFHVEHALYSTSLI